MPTTQVIKAITDYSTVTTPKLSGAIYVGGAKRVGIHFNQTNHSSGSITFTVQASMDDYDTVTPVFVDFNLLVDNVTNDNTHHETRVNGKTLTSTNDAIVWIDCDDYIVMWLQITAVITTDGHANATI